MNDESQLALTRFDFTSGSFRGSQLMLYPRCLVHRSASQLETVPLSRVTAIKVSFARNARRLGWGMGCVVIALALLAISAPLGSFAHDAAQDLTASGQGVAHALYSFFRFVELLAAVMPAIALAGAVAGAMLAVLGWRGSTTLMLAIGGSDREYSVRGRDKLLLDFAEMVTERLMATDRRAG
ncbi:MAG TPA: hypothetical protein VEU32_05995 [Burkholderiales bacterium]|nr:hypothetical protein [Burkholderiales bacterium]